MITIGLTGGIACGKTLVTDMLAAKGAAVVSADLVGHRSYQKGTAVHGRLVAEFGQDILDKDGEIDRGRLGQKVFADPEARERLNAIVWPVMSRMIAGDLEELRKRGTKVAVLEAALLIEADWLPLADEVWLVTAPPEVMQQRLVESKGLTPEQAEARIRSQLSNEERKKYADIVIENNGTIEALRERVEELWGRLQRRMDSAKGPPGRKSEVR